MMVKTGILDQLIKSIEDEKIEIVDLSQTLNDNTPVIQLPKPFTNTGGFKLKQLSKYDEYGPDFYWNDFVAGEHCGTHLDAPIHWITGKDHDGVDTMPMNRMVGEACVIDIKDKVRQNPDYCLTVEDIQLFEEQYGIIKEQCWVLIHSGWAKYVDDHEKFYNIGDDGMSHTPGITREAAIFLANERNILGVGGENVGIDAGISDSFNPPLPYHYYMLGANKYGIAQLTNLDKLPPRGAVLVVNPLKIENGSGSPVRVIALVEKS